MDCRLCSTIFICFIRKEVLKFSCVKAFLCNHKPMRGPDYMADGKQPKQKENDSFTPQFELHLERDRNIRDTSERYDG